MSRIEIRGAVPGVAGSGVLGAAPAAAGSGSDAETDPDAAIEIHSSEEELFDLLEVEAQEGPREKWAIPDVGSRRLAAAMLDAQGEYDAAFAALPPGARAPDWASGGLADDVWPFILRLVAFDSAAANMLIAFNSRRAPAFRRLVERQVELQLGGCGVAVRAHGALES